MEMKNDLNGLKEEAKIYEREILSMLLEVSKSFTTDEMTKEKREEIFSKIDELREKLKSVSKVIEDIENTKYDCIYKESSNILSEENNVEEKLDVTENSEGNVEKDNEDNSQGFTLTEIETLDNEEVENVENVKTDNETVSVDNVNITEEDLENIDRVIENMNVENEDSKIDEAQNESTEEENTIEEKNNDDNKEESEKEVKNAMSADDAIEKIDKLIKEAKELNKNVIKFPEQNVSRRNRTRAYETIEEIEEDNDEYIENKSISFDYNYNNKVDTNYEVEPVPVLFGNRRVQNQMIIKKKNNGFSDKLRSLIFKIKSMLGGNNDDGDLVVNYLKQKGVTKLDYVIGTHAHEDHIGGMDDVIKNFDEEKILFPKVTATTKTFEDFVNAVKSKNKKLYAPKSGETFEFANSSFEVLAPNSQNYDSANNYSIVIKLKYKNKAFLFMGDAEKISEDEILQKGYDVKSDLIKIGHHGSSTSTSDSFIKKVNPNYAVICVGKNNSYNHPKKTVMDRLKKYNIKVYRTDEQGTITVDSDGDNISFDKEPASYNYMK